MSFVSKKVLNSALKVCVLVEYYIYLSIIIYKREVMIKVINNYKVCKEVKKVILEDKILYVNSDNKILLTRKNKKSNKKGKKEKTKVEDIIFPTISPIGMKNFDEALKDYIRQQNINK